MDVNSAGGRDHGLTHEKIAAVADWQNSEAFTDIERDALSLADAMADAPAHIEEGLFARLLTTHGERGLVELTTAIAWENFRARGNRVFDAQSESYYDGALCMLPEKRSSTNQHESTRMEPVT